MTDKKKNKSAVPAEEDESENGRKLPRANKKKVSVAVQGALNGMIGDQLARDGNPLAIKMHFRQGRSAFSLKAEALEAVRADLTPKLVILVHGLGNCEQNWEFSPEQEKAPEPEVDIAVPPETKVEVTVEIDPETTAEDTIAIDTYGSRLAEQFGYTPLYLRYNSGRQIQDNGARFAILMQQLVAAYPLPVMEILMIGHSMGGLVLRHAQHAAMQDSLSWLGCVSQFVYVGSPHEGADLEKAADMATKVLDSMPRDHTRIWGEWLDFRSSGIKDLRQGVKDLAAEGDVYGLYPQAQHNFISGSLGKEKDVVINNLLGDSLVRISSAQPRNVPENCRMAHFFHAGHVSLTASDKVYQQIVQWIEETGFTPGPAAEERVHESPEGLSDDDDTAEGELANASGAVELTGKLFEQVIDTVGRVQRSVAADVYTVLGAHPDLKAPVGAVKSLHEGIASAVNKSASSKGKFAFGAVKWVLDAVAERETAEKPMLKGGRADQHGTDKAPGDGKEKP